MSPEGTAHWASISRQKATRTPVVVLSDQNLNFRKNKQCWNSKHNPPDQPNTRRKTGTGATVCLVTHLETHFHPSQNCCLLRCDGTEHDPSSWGVTWWYLLVLDLCGALHRRISGGVKIENPLKMSSQRFITFPSVLRSGYAGSRYGLKIEIRRWNLKHFVKYPL